MNAGRALFILAALALPLAYGAGVDGANIAAIQLCVGLMSIMPIAAMLMIVLAGAIYAAGQMMGSETRSRSNVWATACLAGAIMAVLITTIGPAFIGAIFPGITCNMPTIQYTQPCTVSQGCICHQDPPLGAGCSDSVCINGKTCTPCTPPGVNKCN